MLTNITYAVTKDFQTWANFAITGSLSPIDTELSKVRYLALTQERFADDSTKFFQTLLRGGLGYEITPKFSLWAGYDWLHTENVFVTEAFNINTPWQQFMWQNDFYENFSFVSRTRLEERFFQNTGELIWRLRQLVKVGMPIGFIPNTELIISNELFINLNGIEGIEDPGLFENRFFIGLGYQINKNLGTQIGYLNQYVEDFESEDILTNILYVSISLSFK